MIRSLLRNKNTQKPYHSQHVLTNYVQATTGSNYAKRRQNIDFSLESKQLRLIYPSLVEEILNELLFYHKDRPDLRQRYTYFLDYTCYLKDLYLPDSLFCIHAYKLFEKSALLTEENLKRVYILAWCFRFISSSMLISDDIMDKSTLRYNKRPWYMSPGVGVDNAMCDAALLQNSVTFLLLNHFSSHPQFKNIQKELVRNYTTEMVSQQIDIKPLEVHEFEKNQEYVKAYPATVPYVLCPMYLANIDDPRLLSIAREFLIDLSIFLKIEDDIECVFVKSEKDCTDIARGKNTWLAIQAYKQGNETQRNILRENYGKDNKKSVFKVAQVFKELSLEKQHSKYKEDFYEFMFERIQQLPIELPKQVFLDILDYAMMGKIKF